MSNLIDEPTVRKFIELVHARAAAALSHVRRPGHLQLVSIFPDDRGMSFSPFAIGDVDSMLEAVLTDARAGRNTYIETRTVRPGRPKERRPGRGKADATIGTFAFVVDSDADKGRAAQIDGDASAVIETSPGNRHIWLFLHRALSAGDAEPLGKLIRKATGADHNTGVVTQPYRVPGTPNYPDARKRARGRVVVPNKLISVSDKLWVPSEIESCFTVATTPVAKVPVKKVVSKASRTTATARVKRKLARKVTADTDRSAEFQSAVASAVRGGVTPEQFEDIARKNPDGCAGKYLESGDRLRAEIDRSWQKVGGGDGGVADRGRGHGGNDHDHLQGDHGDDHLDHTGDQHISGHGAGIDGAALLDDVYEFFGRFVCYPSKEGHVAHVLWTAHSHLMDCWETTPRLAFLSPEAASGKTRALEVSELLVPQPMLTFNVSPAYIVRKVAAGTEEGILPTLLYDEIDALFGSKAKEGHEDVRALLNAGYRRGATIGRVVMRGSIAETEELPAFCAVALAGLNDLPDTIHSRAVIVRMKRRAPHETMEPYRRREREGEGYRLRDRLAAWAAAVGRGITAPDMPNTITDRDADIWEPLIAVADAAGNHWADTVRVTAVTLVTLSRETGRERLGIRLLADLRTVFGGDDRLATKTILERLRALDESPWNDLRGKPLDDLGLARRLRNIGNRKYPPAGACYAVSEGGRGGRYRVHASTKSSRR